MTTTSTSPASSAWPPRPPRARSRGDRRAAAALLRDALELWRGPPLADLAYESFAEAACERLEELRLAALEERMDAELALGRQAPLVAELEALVAEHPLRERLRGQLMLALYRSRPAGRGARGLPRDAARACRELRDRAVRRRCKRSSAGSSRRTRRSSSSRRRRARASARCSWRRRVTTVRAHSSSWLRSLPAQLVLARLADRERDLAAASAAVRPYRSHARTAAFTSDDRVGDLVRLASANEADLVLVDAPRVSTARSCRPRSRSCSSARLRTWRCSRAAQRDVARGVHVPFGGGEHDWAALELGASLASATGAPLRLVGTRADPRSGRRDASRLLADASLAVQRVVEVDAAPVLADPDELVDAVAGAGLVVVGISPRWRSEGIGAARRALVRDARPPVLLVHRGPRPGLLAPHESRTRFTLDARLTTVRRAGGRAPRDRAAYVAAVVTLQPIRGERYCPDENVP